MMLQHRQKTVYERSGQTINTDLPGWPGNWGPPSFLLSILDDEFLVAEAMNGDNGGHAFTEMFIRYWNYLYVISWKMKFSEEDAEELTQDSFFRCYKYPYDKSRCVGFATYLWKLAKWGRWNNLTQRLGRAKDIPEDKLLSLDRLYGDDKAGMPLANLVPDTSPGPEEEFYAKELEVAVWDAYLKLKREAGAVFYLSVYKRLGNEKIAEVLGKSFTNVNSLLYLARRRVKVLMRRDGYSI